MHHIYHTEGIILGSRSHGEAGKYYHILTKDLGMVRAVARGVRNMPSRLRYILQDFAYVKIDLVQGKDVWRLTSGTKTNKLENITKQVDSLKIMHNMAQLLRRLLPGTEKNEELFTELVAGMEKLESAKMTEELDEIEIDIVLRILQKLGYLEGGERAINRKEAISLINKVLKETML